MFYSYNPEIIKRSERSFMNHLADDVHFSDLLQPILASSLLPSVLWGPHLPGGPHSNTLPF